jgi:hypothetical protein
MKIPSAEKANLRPSELHNRRRLAQGRRLPGLTGGNAVKGVNEIGYFGEDGAGDHLMLRHHREFSRHLRHPGSLERGVELVGRPRLELQPILSSCWQNFGDPCKFYLAGSDFGTWLNPSLALSLELKSRRLRCASGHQEDLRIRNACYRSVSVLPAGHRSHGTLHH